jgi:hypothetical protein
MALPRPIVQLKVGPPGATNAKHFKDLYIRFTVKRTDTRKPNTADISILNLGPDSREYLKTPGLAAVLLAGDDYPAQLFAGDIGKRGISHVRDGATITTTIKAGDGRRIWRDSWFSKSYPPGTNRDLIFNDLVAELGAPLGSKGSLPPYTFAGPVAFNAPARDALTEVLAVDLSSWNLIDGAIYYFAFGATLPGNAIVLSTDTGLMGSPTITDKGVNCKVRLKPEIRERSLIQLRSKEITSPFRVATCNHIGDTYARSWETAIQARPI